MPTLEFQAIVNSLQSAIFTPGNLVTVSAMTTVANVPVLDLTVNQIDTDSFTLDETTTPPTLRITAHPEQSPWHSPIDAAGFYVFDIQYIQFSDGTIQTTAFNSGAVGQTPWLSDIDADSHNLDNVLNLRFTDLTSQATAFPGISFVQTPWLQDINANGFKLSWFSYVVGGGVEIRPAVAQFPLTIRNSANTAWDWYVAPDGNMTTDTGRTITKLGAIGFADLTTQTTAYKGIAATQTPWLQSIDGAGRSLSNVATLNVNGLIVSAAHDIRPLAATNPWLVYNSGGVIDWGIDVNGHLASDTNRSLARIGAISFSPTGAGTLTFKDGTVQTTAFAAGSGAQTPWQTNIDGGAHTLTNVSSINAGGIVAGGGGLATAAGGLLILPKAGDNAVIIYNAGATAADWAITPDGSLVTNTGRGIYNISTLRFSDSTNQITAFPGIPATQTPWLQNIDGARKTLSQVGQIIIWPVAGVQRFGITNDAGSGWDWLVDSTGNLSSATFKSILTLGSIGFADTTVQTTAYLGVAATQTPWKQNINGAGFSLTSAGAAVDVACLVVHGIAATNRLLIFDTSGGLEWFIDPNGHLNSNTTRSITTGGYINGGALIIRPVGVSPVQIVNQANTGNDWEIDGIGNLTSPTHREIKNALHLIMGDGTNFSAVLSQQVGLILGHLKPIDWASGPDYYGTIDVRLARASAGVLSVLNPSTAAYADFNCHALTASNVIRAAAIIVGPSGDVRSDTFSITGFGTGITGTFTTAGGQTVTVRGGIILSIV